MRIGILQINLRTNKQEFFITRFEICKTVYISEYLSSFLSFLSYIFHLSEQLPIFLLSTAYYNYKLQVFIFCKKS